MSRAKATLKNAKYGLVLYLISIFLSFFSRDFFLRYLGDEFNGLVSVLRSIISLLGIAELGIATSISYRLFKPLHQNNKDEINQVMGLFGYFYYRIAFLISFIGIVVALFLRYFVDDVPFDSVIVYFIYFSFLLTTLVGYFFNYQQTLLNADQKNYVVQLYTQLLNIAKIITQIIILYFYQSYIWWTVIELVYPLIYSYVLRKKVKSIYPWLSYERTFNKTVLVDYKEIIGKIKQVFVHRLGAFMLSSTSSIFISIFSGLTVVTYYGNYNLIIQSITLLLNNVFSNIGSGIGNLIAENNPTHTRKVFNELMVFRFFVGAIIVIPMYFVVNQFIFIWLGYAKYILPSTTVILILLHFFIIQIRTPVDNFIYGYGLFQDTWAPTAEFLINLGVTLLLGKYLGLNGVLLGALISMFCIVILWKPYFLFKNGFKQSVIGYWVLFFKLFIPILLTFFTVYFIHFKMSNPLNNYFNWLLYSTLIFSLVLVELSIMYLVLFPEFKNTIIRVKGLLKR